MASTQELDGVSTKIQRIAQLAKRHPDRSFVSLSHHIDLHWLWEAYERIRKDAAAGIDGVTAEVYEQDLLGNLQRLLEAAKSGDYKAPPVRRVWIAKGDGSKTRPIGIPTLEDKILQRAVVMILEAIFEQDFLEVSYGFRPNRSAHLALDAVWTGLSRMGGRDRHQILFRQDRSYAPTGFLIAKGTRRCAASVDRQMAQGGCSGRRPAELPGRGIAAGVVMESFP